MKFGRLEDDMLADIVWDLPQDAPSTRVVLGNSSVGVHPPVIHIGCPVWADRSFLGKLYEPRTPTKDFLNAYSKQFSTVELNATFYGMPKIERVLAWKRIVGDNFRFCPKVPRPISHGTNVETTSRLLASFIDAALNFEGNLGMAFMQLPAYFQPSRFALLQQLLAHVPTHFPLALEVRHPLWFSDCTARQELFSYLQDRGISAVITDTAGRRDVLHQTLTTSCAFIRFTGNNLHATDYVRIDHWITKIHNWITQGLSTVYFFLHQPIKLHCVDLAIYMIKRLNTLLATRLPSPRSLQ